MDTAFAFVDNQHLLFCDVLCKSLSKCMDLNMAVAYILSSGLNLIVGHLASLRQKNGIEKRTPKKEAHIAWANAQAIQYLYLQPGLNRRRKRRMA